MHPWVAMRLYEHKAMAFRAEAEARRTGSEASYARPPASRRIAETVSVWCGYRMIGLGSRLLRPALAKAPVLAPGAGA